MVILGKWVKKTKLTYLEYSLITLVTVLPFFTGCASIDRETVRFDPLPFEDIDTTDLDPVTPEGGNRLRLANSHSESFSNLEIPYPLPKPVTDELNELQHSYPQSFARGLNRSTRYMPYLREEFRKAGLPEDLTWMAMVESMFQPKVVSHAGAGGMWQFMRATGRHYHLRMDSYVDERYNWHSSTRAAIDYLKALHDFFDGDWALAITAYNMGEGGLARAIKSNKGERDFFTLIKTPPASNRIKQETKKYYPRLIAYIIASQNPEKYGFEQKEEPFEDVLRIPVEKMYYLSDLDKAMGLAKGTLAQLNPDLLREATPPHGKYAVAVPREKHSQFLAALKTVKSVRYAGTHRVKRGETISQIARKYGVSQRELMRINKIRSARSLQINKKLQLPLTGTGQGGRNTKPTATTSRTDSNRTRTKVPPKVYKVKRGDTLSEIARAHHVKLSDLRQWNNLKNRSKIRIGQTLKIGSSKASPSKEPLQYHTVKPGEYPGIIAQLYSVSVNDLLRWNNLNKKSVLQVGDKLVIAGKGSVKNTQTAETKPKKNTTLPSTVKHKIAKGETAGEIAERYGVSTRDLLSCNKLTAKSILRVGKTLTVRNPKKGMGQRDHSGDTTLTQAENRVVHKVTAGQNPSTIAKKYGVRVKDLFTWNNWKNKHVLQIGDEVSIYRD